MDSFHITSSIWQRTCRRFTVSSGRASICVVFTPSPYPPPYVDRITWTTATIQIQTHTHTLSFKISGKTFWDFFFFSNYLHILLINLFSPRCRRTQDEEVLAQKSIIWLNSRPQPKDFTGPSSLTLCLRCCRQSRTQPFQTIPKIPSGVSPCSSATPQNRLSTQLCGERVLSLFLTETTTSCMEPILQTGSQMQEKPQSLQQVLRIKHYSGSCPHFSTVDIEPISLSYSLIIRRTTQIKAEWWNKYNTSTQNLAGMALCFQNSPTGI